jgi:hypothetical protein
VRRDRELGLWWLLESRWLDISGTTPASADCWSVSVMCGGYDLNLSVEHYFVYAQVGLWRGNRYSGFTIGEHRMHRKFPFAYYCSCTCQNKSSKKPGRKKS